MVEADNLIQEKMFNALSNKIGSEGVGGQESGSGVTVTALKGGIEMVGRAGWSRLIYGF